MIGKLLRGFFRRFFTLWSIGLSLWGFGGGVMILAVAFLSMEVLNITLSIWWGLLLFTSALVVTILILCITSRGRANHLYKLFCFLGGFAAGIVMLILYDQIGNTEIALWVGTCVAISGTLIVSIAQVLESASDITLAGMRWKRE